MNQIVFLYNKSNTFGLAEDVKVFELGLREACRQANIKYTKPRLSDYLEHPVICDAAFHFEIPIYSYFPWARRNILIVNPEWYEESWNSYLSKLDGLIFKCKADAERFTSSHTVSCPVYVVKWTTPVKPSDFSRLPKSTSFSDTGALWLLGASQNKRAAAQHILPLWKDSWPPLKVYTTTPLSGSYSANVTIIVQDLPENTRRTLQALHPVHLIFSQSEALGLQAHEAQSAGAVLLGNALPTYTEAFQAKDAILLESDLVPFKAGVKDTFSKISQEALQQAIDSILSLNIVRGNQSERWDLFVNSVKEFVTNMPPPLNPVKTLPPVLHNADCPSISIVTLLHNRRKFVDLAFHNLLLTDYPKKKIEWVVVEDSDKTDEQASDKIMKFARQCMEDDTISVSYIPLPKPVSIGEKRNIACERAQHDIILMMDDDDHYPPSSFRRRVAWLSGAKAACCTTIACYDLLKGTSAVNTPPFTLGLKERVSEATLTFYKSFWQEKHFPTVSIAEGEGFLDGREECVLELQPQQIIVAMSHNQNQSSRRIPPGPSGKPSCFWGFPPEFLRFLHGLAGVAVEEEKTDDKLTKAKAKK